jgi:hypothetical protein
MMKSRILLLPLFLILAAGCNKGNPNAPAEVYGTVTYKGSPVTAGYVTFYAPNDSGVYNINIKPDGTFSQTDVPVGEMTITVETESANPNKKKPSDYGGGRGGAITVSPKPGNAGGGSAPAGDYVKIPAKYADRKKSGLTYTVTKGKQKHDIELTD